MLLSETIYTSIHRIFKLRQIKNGFSMLLEIIYEWISIPAKTYYVWISKTSINNLFGWISISAAV